jgi:hypothetical protein
MKKDRDRDREKRREVRSLSQISVLGTLFLAAVVAASGCGKKADPRAPELSIPETIKDLRARADARGISLTWSRPTRYVGGRELRDLAAFVVFRREASSGCPDCPAPYRERATLSVEDQEKFMKKKQLGFVDEELTPQTTYRYRVFSQLRDGSLSNPSNEVEISWKP